MGTSRSLPELARKLERAANSLPKKVERIVVKVALEVNLIVVTGTPVLTGRARNNWLTSIGVILIDPDEGPGPFDKSGGFAIALALQVLSRYRLQDGPVYIANSLSYIGPLERGHSSQAPSGMVQMAVLAGIAVARRARIRIIRA